VAVTKLDILDVLPEVKIGIAYKLDGKELNHFPTSSAELGSVEVSFHSFRHLIH
jgi:adenylosuccinate synthase